MGPMPTPGDAAVGPASFVSRTEPTVVTGSSKDEKYQAEMAKAGYFFMGKISVQDPDLDIGPHLRRILLEPTFGKQYRSESTRCLAEVETGRLKMAKAGKDLSKGP